MNKTRIASVLSGALFLMCQAAPLKAGESDIVWEESIHVEAWSSKVAQRHHGPLNSDAILLDVILVAKGRHRLLAKDIVGPIVLYESERKILSCESHGSTMAGPGPLVFDLNGQRTKGPKHPGYLRECARVERSRFLLLHYNLVKDGRPYNLVRILSTEGRIVLEQKFYSAGEIIISDAAKTYKVRVPEPEWPG